MDAHYWMCVVWKGFDVIRFVLVLMLLLTGCPPPADEASVAKSAPDPNPWVEMYFPPTGTYRFRMEGGWLIQSRVYGHAPALTFVPDVAPVCSSCVENGE